MRSEDPQLTLTENTKKAFGLAEENIFYDCTNFYCETEEEDEDIQSDADGEILVWGMRRYGHSKENRPNPIVQLGLFTDGEGIPMAYGGKRKLGVFGPPFLMVSSLQKEDGKDDLSAHREAEGDSRLRRDAQL